MTSTPKLRIASIGLGDIARKAYLPIIATHPRIEPVLYTRNAQTLKHLADKYRISETFSDIDDVIASGPDAAMVHSSTESHPYMVSKLLRAGIPTFVDKPLSYSLEESEKLLEIATKSKTPIYVGFNRRFAPLIKTLSEVPDPIQVAWHKNRVALPGDPRTFIFDDFIHVIDGLRFLGKGPVKDLHVAGRVRDGKLKNVQVHWQQGATYLSGGMNRVSGVTEETVHLFSEDNKWEVNELHSGNHYHKGAETALGFGNWEATLYKRGFVGMIDDWIDVVVGREYDAGSMEDIWETHALCERILGEVGR